MQQKHFYHYKGLKVLKSSHPEVRRIKRQQSGHSAHGNKVWRSSFVMLDYLETYPLKENTNVLEIGCGWGLVGLYLKKFQKLNTVSIDIDPTVKPYFDLQTRINECEIKFKVCSFESLCHHKLSKFNYIVGSDICFWDELTPPLFKFIEKAKELNIEQILIADPGRPPFWKLSELCAKNFGSEVITRRISKPWRSEKYILNI